MEKLVVIGGGAAGFFCAVNAARLNPGLQVAIVEKSSKLLSKVRISGGGRCNVTHACFDIPVLVKKYPRGGNFLKKTFHQFDTKKCIKWFEERGVKLKTETDGRMFPVTDSSQTVIECLLKEANRYNVQILMNREVKQLAKEGNDWLIVTADYSEIAARYVCVACGGYPKSAMFKWLTDLGHSVEEPVPSLFTFNMPRNPICKLMGLSVEHTRVKIEGSKLTEEGPLLITHWGMSGPVILRLSAWGARELSDKNYEFRVHVNWVSGNSEQDLRDQWPLIRNEKASQKMANRNPFNLPARLWSYLLAESGIGEDTRWADLPGKEQNRLIKNLSSQEFDVRGKTTFKEEFVTSGGIRLGEIDAGTMQSKIAANLFFAGEIVDVDGITGGFNFQHAWTSGWIAAKAISKASNSVIQDSGIA